MVFEDFQVYIPVFFENFFQSALFVFSPGQRLFWVSIISSVVIILVFLKFQGRTLNKKLIKRIFFSKKYWFGPSARKDFFWLGINVLTKSILATVFLGSQLIFTMIVAYWFQSRYGTISFIEIPWLIVALTFTLTLFIFEDFSRFLLHRAMHRLPFFWQFHKVHHSATTLTPLTLHRVHPVETCLYFFRGILVFGIVSGVFVYIFGGKLTALDILGVEALGFLFNVMGANLRHSHIWFGFGKFESVFISPAQHQIHHSSLPQHIDSNFGTCLAIWDKLMGTWISSRKRPNNLAFGISQPDIESGSGLFLPRKQKQVVVTY